MRETLHTPELAQSILDEMTKGTSLRKACEARGVNKSTFLNWVDTGKVQSDHYARAREQMLDAQAEELEQIGDEAANADTAVKVAGLRLKADNRKWLLSKLAPKKYGERVELAGDKESPLFLAVERRIVDPKS